MEVSSESHLDLFVWTTKTEVFEYDGAIRHTAPVLLSYSHCFSIFVWTGGNFSNTLSVDVGKNISVFKNPRTREQDTVNEKYCTCLEPRNEDPGY